MAKAKVENVELQDKQEKVSLDAKHAGNEMRFVKKYVVILPTDLSH